MTSSVVIVSYRPGDWLDACVASVAHQADQIVVVDNGSAGGEAGRLARAAGAAVVTSPTNVGFAGGVNLGVRAATGDLIALLNDDATAAPGWLARAAEVLDEPEVAAVTPKVLLSGWWREVTLDDEAWSAPGDSRRLGRRIRAVIVEGVDVLAGLTGTGIHRLEEGDGDRWRWTTGAEPFYVPLPHRDAAVSLDGEALPPGPVCRLVNNAGALLRTDAYVGDYGLETPDDGRFDTPGERFGVSGTAIVTRADVWARLGGLAEPYFAYYEDSDWSWRARLAGLRLAYDPWAVVEHRRSATSGGLADPRVHLLGERNRLLTALRNAPAPVAARLLAQRVREGPQYGIRRAVTARLPWALASRVRMSRAWVRQPEEVWDAWAGRDTEWDRSPTG